MSLIEALVTVMVLGTLAAVAYAFLSGVTDSAHTEKARNDVASLNRAVEIFVSNGGSIDPEASAEEVIALLKGHASTEQADYHVGLSGSKIDPRLTPVPVSALESDTPGTRIRWDGSAHRFTVEDDATGPGISAFVLVDNAAENGDHQIQLSDGVFTYAKEDTWIWDYQDAVATPLVGPSTIPTTAPPADTLPPPSSGGTPPAAVPPGPPSPPVAAKLDPPLFSIAAGKHPLKDFRLSLTLSDPNTAGAGKIRYRLNSGAAWEDYEEREALMIDPDDKVDAFVESNSPAEYENSVVAGASYWTDPVTLALNVTADKSGVTYYDLTENAVYARAIVTNLDEIPAHLQSAGLFEILWSGSPSSGGGVLLDAEKDSGSGESLVRLGTGLWNNTPDLVLQSIAKADGSPWVKSSATETLSLTAVSLPLPPPDVSTVDIGDGKFQVSMSHTGKVPPGAAIYFNLAGESPASTPGAGLPANATRYSGPFLWEPDDDGSTGSGSATVLATAFPPASLGLWFDPSPPAAATVALPPTNKADGGPYALVKESMVLDGTVIGNIRNLNAAGININGTTRVTGDILLSGTPSITVNGKPSYSGVAEGDGPDFPSGYQVMINSGAQFGYLGIKSDPEPFPDVDAPPNTSGAWLAIDSGTKPPAKWFPNSGVNVNPGAGSVHVPPGNYGAFAASNAGNGGEIVLGSTDGGTAVYNFQSFNINSGVPVRIVGPVVINTAEFAINGGSNIGSPEMKDQLQINVSGNQFIDNASGKLYAKSIVVPYGTTNINGKVHASVTTKNLIVNGPGTLFLEEN